MDWGFAETMAYATVVDQGYPLRLVGQDSARGTFFHRHAVLHNQSDGGTLTPLQLVNPAVGVTVVDSLLSEEAVLGFEYGYATAAPDTLVIWEAQFGDFANGAQVVIDQFIASGEAKWGRLCGLTMFLPHGYEGQGPEHSSGRLERFLQLCANHNIQVCVPSTPAQMFHLLRRQMLQPTRKPLIVMTPKACCAQGATSQLKVLTGGRFQQVIGDRGPDRAEESGAGCSAPAGLLRSRRGAMRERPQVAVMRRAASPFGSRLRGFVEFAQRSRVVPGRAAEPGRWYQIRHHLQAASRNGMGEVVGRPHSHHGGGLLHVHLRVTGLVNEAIM
jgi:2-oxoglutarate dehydrogenase E1 component